MVLKIKLKTGIYLLASTQASSRLLPQGPAQTPGARATTTKCP